MEILASNFAGVLVMVLFSISILACAYENYYMPKFRQYKLEKKYKI